MTCTIEQPENIPGDFLNTLQIDGQTFCVYDWLKFCQCICLQTTLGTCKLHLEESSAFRKVVIKHTVRKYEASARLLISKQQCHLEWRNKQTSSFECTCDLWVPLSSFSFLSYAFAKVETSRLRALRLSNIITETPFLLK